MNILSKNKILILFIVFLIAREVTPINFSLYKSYSEISASSSTESSTKDYDVNAIPDESPVINLDNKNTYPIELRYEPKDKTRYKNGSKPIKVYITKDNYISKLRFIPLIKLIAFSSDNTYNWDGKIYNDGKTITIEGSGNINLEGNKNIYGLCSGKESKALIDKMIIEHVQKQIQKDINAQLAALKAS